MNANPSRHYLALSRPIGVGVRTSACVGLALALVGCGEPSRDDLVSATGHTNIKDVSCAQASGQPGYVCTYFDTNTTVTHRFVKLDSGKWDVIYGR